MGEVLTLSMMDISSSRGPSLSEMMETPLQVCPSTTATWQKIGRQPRILALPGTISLAVYCRPDVL